MIIIFNLIALGVCFLAFVIALFIGHVAGVTGEEQLILIAAPIAAFLDLCYRAKTGRWFHPRGGGALFFVPVWILGLLLLPVGAAQLFGPHGRYFHSAPSPTSLSWATPASPSRITSEAAGRREALRLYPSLAVANSPLNLEFVRRYRRYQQDNPAYFRDPSWPVTLANECATPLGIQGASR